MGEEAFPLKTYLLKLYPGSQSKGDNEKSIFNYMLFRSRGVEENTFGILSQKFQIYQRTLQSLPANADIIFVTYILHSYLRSSDKFETFGLIFQMRFPPFSWIGKAYN